MRPRKLEMDHDPRLPHTSRIIRLRRQRSIEPRKHDMSLRFALMGRGLRHLYVYWIRRDGF